MQTGEDRVAVVESGDDEGLNKNTTACFVKTTSPLSNYSKVDKACSGRGEDMLCHVKFAVQENTEVTYHIGWWMHCGSRLRFFIVLSSTLLRRSNQISSVLWYLASDAWMHTMIGCDGCMLPFSF